MAPLTRSACSSLPPPSTQPAISPATVSTPPVALPKALAASVTSPPLPPRRTPAQDLPRRWTLIDPDCVSDTSPLLRNATEPP